MACWFSLSSKQPAAAAGSTAADAVRSGGIDLVVAGLIDLNRASLEELDRLPGIGPVTAQAIVEHRTTHGPFRSVDELVDVKGVGPATLEKIRALITVGN